jgi:hypothetical protein
MSDRRRGRTPVWTTDRKAVAMERICDRIAAGEPLHAICADPWMPHRVTVLDWVREDGSISRQYRRAMEERAYMRSDRIDGYMRDLLAGKITPAAARVLVDTERWLMSKEHPRCFGPKVTIEQPRRERTSEDQLETRINQLSGKTTPAGAFGLPVRTGARGRVMGSYNG